MTSWTPSDVRCWATSLCKLFIRGRYSLPQCIRTAITSTFFAWVSQTSGHEFRFHFLWCKTSRSLEGKEPLNIFDHWTVMSHCDRLLWTKTHSKHEEPMRTLLETRQLTQAQENECGQVTIGFGFAFYRLRDWGEFFFFQTNHRLSGENQT